MPATSCKATYGLMVVSALFVAACGESRAAPAIAQGGALQVVELFQSQGCSSCPPANRNVLALADRPDILALSWQVTYWDYLGWKDSFAQQAFTDRQRAYAQALGHGNVYTPQVVINGKADLVGANAAQLRGALQRFARVAGAVKVRIAGDQAVVSGPTGRASVYLVRYDPRTIQVPVRAGENGGRTLPHRNVVREVRLIGSFSGGTRAYVLPAARNAVLRTAILVQREAAGPIIAAARK